MMKLTRRIIYFMAAAWCLTAFSCSNDEDSSKTVQVLPASVEITDFFETHLPGAGQSDCFFQRKEQDPDTLSVCVVNSMAELEKLCYAPVQLPQIDFSQRTLIIGWYMMPNSYYHVGSQKLYISSSSAQLYIETLPQNFVHPTFSRMFFWGFYPKTNVKDIKVKVKIN